MQNKNERTNIVAWIAVITTAIVLAAGVIFFIKKFLDKKCLAAGNDNDYIDFGDSEDGIYFDDECVDEVIEGDCEEFAEEIITE